MTRVLHILHITTAKGFALQHGAPQGQAPDRRGLRAPPLVFSDADYARLGHQIKCNPAIKTAADRDAVRAAVASGVIDVIATDHAPHTWDEKSQAYFKAPSGLPPDPAFAASS
jgi:dihydroorotase